MESNMIIRAMVVLGPDPFKDLHSYNFVFKDACNLTLKDT